MPAATNPTHTHQKIRAFLRLLLEIRFVGAADRHLHGGFVRAAHAMVRMVPVVSELLNLIENVSPFCNVNADP